MQIIVCIKQVPNTAEVKINPETNTLSREGAPGIINPYDVNAIEEGLLLKERFGGSVTVLSMGPPQVDAALREAISLGVDQAVLLSDRAFAGADTLATSYTLAAAIRKIGVFDLVICGKQAIDGDTAQVGPEIAEWLDIPHLVYVSSVDEVGSAGITVSRLIDGGCERTLASLPALVTVVREANEPRLPSFRSTIRAKTQEIVVWGAGDLGVDPERIGLAGSPTKVDRIFVPQFDRKGQLLTGRPDEQAKALIDKLLAQIISGGVPCPA